MLQPSLVNIDLQYIELYTIIRKIPNKTAIAVEKAMNTCYDNTTLPMLTITYDNGTEFANHQNIANTLGCNIYFATPYRSCERGLNEHTNGKIRYFFPKKLISEKYLIMM